MKLTVKEICDATGGELLQGDDRAIVRSVSIDSRKVKKSGVFIAIKGERLDAHRFLKKIVADGCRVVIVHKPVRLPKSITVILVVDTTKALGDLAAYYRQQFDLMIIAITGSVGKTTTKAMIAAILKKKYNVLVSPASFNNHIGVPLTLFQLKPAHEIAVIELGTNQPGDIAYLARIVKPNVGMITNIGVSHLEGLKTVKGILREKTQLLKHCTTDGVAILNQDDQMLEDIDVGGLVKVTYGVENQSDVSCDGTHVSFRVGRQLFQLNSPSIDYVYNALAAICCGQLFKVSIRDMVDALLKVRLPKGRQQISKANGITIIDDTYNANPTSFRSAIDSLCALKCRGKCWLVAGDMKELGVHTDYWHRDVAQYVAKKDVDEVVGIGDGGAIIAQESKKQHKTFQKYDALINYLKDNVVRGDVVLVKGSRAMKLEQIIDALKNI